MNPGLTHCFVLQKAAGTGEHPEEGNCYPRKGWLAGEEDFGLQPTPIYPAHLASGFSHQLKAEHELMSFTQGLLQAQAQKTLTAPKKSRRWNKCCDTHRSRVITVKEAGAAQQDKGMTSTLQETCKKGEPGLLWTTGWLQRKLAKELFRFKLQKWNWTLHVENSSFPH